MTARRDDVDKSPASTGAAIIAAVLRYDAKTTSYKIALLRALNDVVLGYPEIDVHAAAGKAVAVPLRLLADRWIAFYWPFSAPGNPILQGRESVVGGVRRNDLSFRPALSALCLQWEALRVSPRAGDGFLLISDMELSRKRAAFPPSLLNAYTVTLRAVMTALEMPIRHAGPSGAEYGVFPKPRRLDRFDAASTVALPGAEATEVGVAVPPTLWIAFRELSLYVEALCVHEWALFTERLPSGIPRGEAYALLTDRPDNRVPLTWERNHVNILLMEGQRFTCPWTERTIVRPDDYDLDHLIPVSVYAVNALWNLVPADRAFNQKIKRDRLPSDARLARAEPYLSDAYRRYALSAPLGRALAEDAATYFAVPLNHDEQPAALARATVGFASRIATARNLPTF